MLLKNNKLIIDFIKSINLNHKNRREIKVWKEIRYHWNILKPYSFNTFKYNFVII